MGGRRKEFTGKFGGGTVTFTTGGSAAIESCVEDGYIKSGVIDFNLRCFAKWTTE